MKWKTKVVEPVPAIGDKRQRAIFALRIRKCSDGYTRWLEVVLIDETFIDEQIGGEGMMDYHTDIQYWKEIAAHSAPVEPAGFDGL